jgi:hypothetical protein
MTPIHLIFLASVACASLDEALGKAITASLQTSPHLPSPSRVGPLEDLSQWPEVARALNKVSQRVARDRPFSEKITAFLAWCEKVGIRWPALELAPSRFGGLGTIAKRDIAVGEAVMCVPQTAIFDRWHFAKSGLAPMLAEEDTGSKGCGMVRAFQVLFVARMLFDRENEPWGDAAFGPYYDIWPTDPDDLPGLWPLADIEAIGVTIFPSPLGVVKLAASLLHKYPDLFGSPPRPAYSEESLKRAYFFLMARTFGPMEEQYDIPRTCWTEVNIIPAFDHSNHEADAHIHKTVSTGVRGWTVKSSVMSASASLNSKAPVDVERRATHCWTATRPYARGEEFFNYYSNQNVMGFFPQYGFMHSDVSTDAFHLSISSRIFPGPTQDVVFVSEPSATGIREYKIMANSSMLVSVLMPLGRFAHLDSLPYAEKTPEALKSRSNLALCDICSSREVEEAARVIIRNLLTGLTAGMDRDKTDIAENRSKKSVLTAMYRLRFKEYIKRSMVEGDL